MPGCERNCSTTTLGLRLCESQLFTITAAPNEVIFTEVAAENARMALMLDGLGAVPSKPQESPFCEVDGLNEEGASEKNEIIEWD